MTNVNERAPAMIRTLFLWLGLVLPALLGGTPFGARHVALAQPASPARRPEPGLLERSRGRIELGLSGRSDVYSTLWVMSGVLSLDHSFSHGFGIGFDWGFFLAAEVPQPNAATQWATGPGDPWLRIWHQHEPSPQDSLRLDAGMTIPAAWLPRDATRRGLVRDGYAFGAATRGLWNAWLWAPQQLALALSGGWSHRLTSALRLRLEAAAAGSLALGQFTPDVGVLYGQLAPALELHGALLIWGARLQAVVTSAGGDPLQWSAQSYLRFERPRWQLQVLGSCNLDEPLGVLGSGLGVCGALLSLGVHP